MKPFVFKFETLLSIRKRREEEANILLFQARVRLKSAQEFLEELRTRQREAWKELREKQEIGAIIVVEFQTWYKFLDFLEKEIKKQQIIVEQLVQEVVTALKVAEKAMKDRKTVEKLRERKLEQYRIELQAEEQKVLDEIAITRYKRR